MRQDIILIKIKTAIIYFDSDFSYGTGQEKSIMKGQKLKNFEGSPVSVCKEALGYMIE